MVYSVLLNIINIAIKSRVKVIKLRHNKKICNLRKQHGIDKLSKTKPPKNIKHNFSSCDRRGNSSFITWFRSTYSIKSR